jgi:hypothetical protein
MNTAGAFHCRCRKGFAPNLECRPVGDLGLTTGGIPDDAISVSDEEADYDKTVIYCFFLDRPNSCCEVYVSNITFLLFLDLFPEITPLSFLSYKLLSLIHFETTLVSNFNILSSFTC